MLSQPFSITTLLSLGLIFILWSLLCLYQNISKARKIGLPYYIFPVHHENLLFQFALYTTFVRNTVEQYFPEWLVDRIYFQSPITRWRVKYREAERRGAVQVIVTPGGVTVVALDAGVLHQVMRDNKVFEKQVEKYEPLKLYGPNIVVVQHAEYDFQKRHAKKWFSEQNNALVWKQSLTQTSELMHKWSPNTSSLQPEKQQELSSTQPDMDFMHLALYVFSSAAFGIPISFFSRGDKAVGSSGFFANTEKPKKGFTYTFPKALNFIAFHIMAHTFLNFIVPPWLNTFLAHIWQTARDHKTARKDFTAYLHAIISTANTDRRAENDTLVSLIAAGEREKALLKSKGEEADEFLDMENIMGNLYVFAIAGHETTARALNFALVLLALNQDKQEVLLADIDEALAGEAEDPMEWEYQTIFPRLEKALFVMLETVRMYSPVQFLARQTTSSTTLVYNNTLFSIPQNTYIELALSSIHYSPSYYGSTASSFDPSRWDRNNVSSYLAQNDGTPDLTAMGLGDKRLHRPVRGAFVGFSDGNRACIGTKFAMVEFVGVLARLLKSHRVEVIVLEGEDGEGARMRAQAALDRSLGPFSLAPAGSVPLVLRRRK